MYNQVDTWYWGVQVTMDEKGLMQGVYRTEHTNRKIWELGYFQDDLLHGEFKMWCDEGKLTDHAFYTNGVDVTDGVKLLVNDLLNISDDERIVLKLKYGFDQYVRTDNN